MCKFKPYNSKIENARKAVSLRFTFFSKPDFLSSFVNEQSHDLSSTFAVRQLNELESERIDVDVISHILGIPLDYVLKDQKTYIFRNVDFGGQNATVYISQFFIFIQINAEEGKKEEIATKELLEFLNLDHFWDKLDLMDVSMVDDYVLGCEKKDLWKVLDKSAFGDVDINKVVDCRYADTHNRDSFKADLVRTIVKRQNSDDKEIYQIFLKSIISPAGLSTEFTTNLRKNLCRMQKSCEHEVTRCFSESFCDE